MENPYLSSKKGLIYLKGRATDRERFHKLAPQMAAMIAAGPGPGQNQESRNPSAFHVGADAHLLEHLLLFSQVYYQRLDRKQSSRDLKQHSSVVLVSEVV